ncbi:Protein TIFY 5A [Morus notabilis]|uniref:Protein TIFY n=1 Tax=Morus notabilis TaxID=981085 RepID=W9S6P7_9ROSA|nr:protein TIFY 5A [Morus notabilis]EXC29332.1 Protein TIFY 5A [Morus notabilis]
MRRNCNLELSLLPTSSAYFSSSGTDSDHQQRTEKLISHESSPNTSNQPLTIFYNGKICVCDVTDFQARAILLLASGEMEERVKTPTSMQSPVYSPTPALSMKRSLQRFLQKRKNRAQAVSPYHR